MNYLNDKFITYYHIKSHTNLTINYSIVIKCVKIASITRNMFNIFFK